MAKEKRVGYQKELEFSEVEEEDNSTLVNITRPFDPKEIDFSTKNLSLDNLIKRLKSDPPAINLHPEFQRNEVWNPEKQSRLIESILLRFPLPAFYFDGSDDSKWEVIDGLQRLSTIRDFVILKTLSLKNLEYLVQLNNLTFDELPNEFQRRIEEAQITAFIIKEGTPESVKYNIFNRINTWGAPLTPQEIRHALNQGKPAKFIQKIANIESFKKATNNINPKRMLDRDFVTRFVAFYLLSFKNYEPDLDTFLNEGMLKIRELDNIELEKLEDRFDKSMNTVWFIFGDNSFRKPNFEGKGRKKPINKALFEALAVPIAKLREDERKLLIEKKKLFETKFLSLMKNNIFVDSISTATGDKKRVQTRFKEIINLIQTVLNDD